MSLKNRFVAELEKSEDVELEPVIHFQGLEDSEMKRIFGKEYCDLVQVIQDLLNEVGTFKYPPPLTILQNRLKMFQGPSGYVYQLVSLDQADKKSQFNDLGDAEMLVYQCIERTGNHGIWIREIKARTGLHSVQLCIILLLQQAINRIIKKLVQRKLIKSFKSIASKMKIMYILYDMGNCWYIA